MSTPTKEALTPGPILGASGEQNVIASILACARKLSAGSTAELELSEVERLGEDARRLVLQLEARAGGRCWRIQAEKQPRARRLLLDSMLLNIARVAGVCPACIADVPRRAGAGLQKYRCASCGNAFADQNP